MSIRFFLNIHHGLKPWSLNLFKVNMEPALEDAQLEACCTLLPKYTHQPRLIANSILSGSWSPDWEDRKSLLPLVMQQRLDFLLTILVSLPGFSPIQVEAPSKPRPCEADTCQVMFSWNKSMHTQVLIAKLIFFWRIVLSWRGQEPIGIWSTWSAWSLSWPNTGWNRYQSAFKWPSGWTSEIVTRHNFMIEIAYHSPLNSKQLNLVLQAKSCPQRSCWDRWDGWSTKRSWAWKGPRPWPWQGWWEKTSKQWIWAEWTVGSIKF